MEVSIYQRDCHCYALKKRNGETYRKIERSEEKDDDSKENAIQIVIIVNNNLFHFQSQ